MKDAILLVVGFVLSIVGAVLGAWMQRLLDRRTEGMPLHKLLNFGSEDLVFVYPPREEIHEAILPRTSTEDFMAMNNFISALLKLGWNRKIVNCDTRHVKDEKKCNLVVVCSPKSNTFALKLQDKLEGSRNVFFYRFMKDKDTGFWHILDPDGGTHYSDSWAQEKRYLDNGLKREDLAAQTFDDLAVITKVRNPWNRKSIAIAIAGLRGIGTWGAAECIKKDWKQIYDGLPEDRKNSEFSVLLKIRYDNCDITDRKIIGKVYTPNDAEKPTPPSP